LPGGGPDTDDPHESHHDNPAATTHISPRFANHDDRL
jgi:hypothetical protein